MKFRIRCGSKTTVVEIENDSISTVNELKTILLQSGVGSTNLGTDIRLSLDGKTPLEDDCSLSDAGLMSGDLLYVLLPPGVQEDNVLQLQGNLRKNVEHSASSLSSDSMLTDVSDYSGVNVNSHTKSSGDVVMSSESSLSYNDTSACKGDAEMMTAEEEEEIAAADTEINRYLNEPMLIRESTDSSLPQSVIKCYYEMNIQSENGAMVVLVKVLMNELGFKEQDKEQIVTNINKWISGQSFQMDFAYPNVDEASFTVLVIPLCRTLFAHGYARLQNGETLNLKLPITVSDFVRSTISGDACETYRGSCLPKLSQMFKDSIAYPLLQFALEGSGLCVKAGLSTLAWELKVAIFKFLDVVSLLRLSEVSQHLNDVCKDRAVWRCLFIRQFGAKISGKDLKQDWKEMYMTKYLERKKLKEAAARARAMYFHPPPAFHPPPIVPLGGGYDIYPFHYDPSCPLNFLPGQRAFPGPHYQHPQYQQPHHGIGNDHLASICPSTNLRQFNSMGSGLPFRF